MKSTGDAQSAWSRIQSTSAITKAYQVQGDSLVLRSGITYRKWKKTNEREFHLHMSGAGSSSGGHPSEKKTLLT